MALWREPVTHIAVTHRHDNLVLVLGAMEHVRLSTIDEEHGIEGFSSEHYMRTPASMLFQGLTNSPGHQTSVLIRARWTHRRSL